MQADGWRDFDPPSTTPFYIHLFFLLAMERGYVRELDLSNCGPASVATRVGVVPGLRSSAGKPGIFFTFFFHLSSFST